MNYKKNILAAALLITPMALWAQPGGGPPAGIGGGLGGTVGGAVGGVSHAGGLGVGSTASGNINATGSTGNTLGMTKAEAHRLDLAAKKAAAEKAAAEAKAKAEAAGTTGAEHANANAAFGQETAAQARTLKDADPATRAAFGDSVSARAKDQGKGGEETGTEPTEPTEPATASTETKSSGAVTAQLGADKANANADFGQSTSASAKDLKTADVETRKTFGADVQTAAKAKTKAKASTSTSASSSTKP